MNIQRFFLLDTDESPLGSDIKALVSFWKRMEREILTRENVTVSRPLSRDRNRPIWSGICERFAPARKAGIRGGRGRDRDGMGGGGTFVLEPSL